ncbi:MAG TPA: hypothetical protein VGH28_20220 [Polyangiaceae bacterium]
MRCVGDSDGPSDGGSDATTDVVVTDAATEAAPTDAGGDADADVASKHAYAANFSGSLLVFDMPLTSASQPTVVLTSNFKQPSDIEIMPGGLQLLVVDGAGGNGPKLFVFDLPITASSVPVTAVSLDFQAIDASFDTDGNLWLAGFANKLEKLVLPLTTSSQPVQTITMPTGNLFGINVTSSDQLFVGGNGHLYHLTLPTDAGAYPDGGLDNQNIAAPTGIAYTNQALLISNFSASVVDDLAVPIQSTTVPTPVGGTVLTSPTRLRFAPNGALGVADAVRGIVMLDAPAFNTASVVVPAQDGGAVTDLRGICFGP